MEAVDVLPLLLAMITMLTMISIDNMIVSITIIHSCDSKVSKRRHCCDSSVKQPLRKAATSKVRVHIDMGRDKLSNFQQKYLQLSRNYSKNNGQKTILLS
jgi:hypothetical protein